MKVLSVVLLLSCLPMVAFAQDAELADGEKLEAYLKAIPESKKAKRPSPEVLEKKAKKKKVLKFKTAHGRIVIDANGVKTLDQRRTMDEAGRKVDEPLLYEFRGQDRLGMQSSWPQAARWLEGVVRLDDDSFVVLTGVVATLASNTGEPVIRKSSVLEVIPVEVTEDGVGLGSAVYMEYTTLNWTGAHGEDFYVSAEWPMQNAEEMPIFSNSAQSTQDGKLQLDASSPLDTYQLQYGDKKSNTLNVVAVCSSKGAVQCERMGFLGQKVQSLKDGKVVVGSGKSRKTCDVKMNECAP
jgi:hypothetical protein